MEEKKKVYMQVKQQNLIIQLNQELDHHIAKMVKKDADNFIDKNQIKNIIFDFSGSQFMDSSGIGVIMGRYKKVAFTGGKVAVVHVGPAVDRILKLSGLYKIVEKYDSLEEMI